MPDRTSQPDQPPMRASASDRVARANARAIAAGAVRVSVILRDPGAIAALARLKDRHGGIVAALTAALRQSD